MEKTPLFKSKLHQTIARGWIEGKRAHQDNIVYIQDITTFVNENNKENKFIKLNPRLSHFYNNYNKQKDTGNGRNHIFLGVFDGHTGDFVSKFLSQTIVFELFALSE